MPTTRSSGRRKAPEVTEAPAPKRGRKSAKSKKAEPEAPKEEPEVVPEVEEKENEPAAANTDEVPQENGQNGVEKEEEPAEEEEAAAPEEEPAAEDAPKEEEAAPAEEEEAPAKEEEAPAEEEKKEEEAPKEEETKEEVVEEKEEPPAPPPTKGRGRKPRKVAVEHCKSWSVFKRNAVQITNGIREKFPDVEVELNATKPRSKSFEITVTFDDGESALVWSGIKKGPPRKEKFPELKVVLEELENQM